MGAFFPILPWMEATNSRKFEVTTLSNFPERTAIIGCQLPARRCLTRCAAAAAAAAARALSPRFEFWWGVIHTPLKTVSHLVFLGFFGCFSVTLGTEFRVGTELFPPVELTVIEFLGVRLQDFQFGVRFRTSGKVRSSPFGFEVRKKVTGSEFGKLNHWQLIEVHPNFCKKKKQNNDSGMIAFLQYKTYRFP
jgi:hypothetical protein